MAKIFNVDQLRLGNKLLTGNAGGELFYDGIKLAAGSTAVPLTRTFTFGDGIRFYDGGTNYSSRDLSADRTINLQVDDTTIGFNSATHPQIQVKDNSINFNKLTASVAGAGLTGGNGAALEVVGNSASGIQIASDKVCIKPLGVLNSMLAGSITDDKLSTITTVGKVQGGAVTLENTSLATGAGKGLMIASQGVGVSEIHAAVAGQGLAGGNGYAIDVGVVSGLAVNASAVGIAPLGVTNAHLAGSIADSKLLTISTADKVYGDAVKLNGTTLSVTSNGLHVNAGGVTSTELATSVAGAGLGGGGGAALFVQSGSGIFVGDDKVHIAETGIVNSMIANGTISEGKLVGGIGADKLSLTYGDGLTISTNDVAVDLHGTRPGLEFDGGKIRVDNTVVRADSAQGAQLLEGIYTFKEDVVMSSGLTVKGDLEIQGNTTITQSNEVEIGDSVIRLNAGYAGASAPDAGFEIERGGSVDHAWLIFDDDSTNKWVAGVSSNGSSNLYRIETSEYNRSYSIELPSGLGSTGIPFSRGATDGFTAFESIPNVTLSIQNTGKYAAHASGRFENLGAMVTGIYTTGVHVSLTSNTAFSGYFLNINANLGTVSTI